MVRLITHMPRFSLQPANMLVSKDCRLRITVSCVVGLVLRPIQAPHPLSPPYRPPPWPLLHCPPA